MLLDRGVRDSAYPGAIAVVGRADGIVATVRAGHLDWAPSPVPDEHTRWDLASLTKVVALTSLVMQDVEAGRLALDAPVQRYLPEWTGPGKERVTLRHLLTHSAGLPPFKLFYRQTTDPTEVRRLVLATPLDTLPGVRMVYSDIGAILLGMAVERVNGAPLDRLAAARIFGPLGMTETGYRPDSTLRDVIAPTEVDPWRGRHLRGEVHDENAFALGGVSAHAGLFSSAHDLARFAQAYLRGGTLDGVRLWSRETIALFTTVQDSTLSNRALGWETPTGGNSAGTRMRRPAFGHTGFTGTSLWIDPAHDLFVVLLTNRVNPTREHSRIGPVRTAVADAAEGLLGATP